MSKLTLLLVCIYNPVAVKFMARSIKGVLHPRHSLHNGQFICISVSKTTTNWYQVRYVSSRLGNDSGNLIIATGVSLTGGHLLKVMAFKIGRCMENIHIFSNIKLKLQVRLSMHTTMGIHFQWSINCNFRVFGTYLTRSIGWSLSEVPL